MNKKQISPSLQDFSTVNSCVIKYKLDYGTNDLSNAFYFLALNLILGLQEDEIRDSITDTSYQKSVGRSGGHDRGIDAVYIDDSDTKCFIHMFNFKYVQTFENLNGNFPSKEIDKIHGFLRSLLSRDENLKNDVNKILYSKIEEIWNIFNTKNPNFVIHICSNHYEGFESNEKSRFERGIEEHANFKIEYHLMPDLVKLLTQKGKKIVDAKIRAVDTNFFEKSDGDIRALIVNFDIKDLLRIVIDNDEMRNNPEPHDYNEMKLFDILEDAFEDNVRVYLRSKINRNIRKTALSDENHRFFYFNNGITITCDNFKYIKTLRSPVIELKNIQVVNGSQTIHALYDAFKDDSSKFNAVDILCRIYETQNRLLSTQIAEYTNSQNPVSSRDIRSIDYIQQKLEQDFLARSLFYERKDNQHSSKPKNQRIDAEKAGQVLMAMFNKMPSEAKTGKTKIFAEKYDDIFNDNVTADKVLLAYRLFEWVEREKNSRKEELENEEFEREGYILYASYWFLYFFGELTKRNSIELVYENIDQIWELYSEVKIILKYLIKMEQDSNKKEKYSHTLFFKHNKPKKHFENLREEDLENILGKQPVVS